MNRKPRILLIPNVAGWVIGEMGKRIIERFGGQYDFYYLPEGLFERRRELLGAFVPYVDAVHCLNESSIDLFREVRVRTPLPPIVTWIHHVTEWSTLHELAVQKSSALTVCTQGWKRYIQARAPQLPITVVPHGVDLNMFRRRESKPGAFGIPPGRFVVGFVGSRGSDLDRGRKGTDILLEAIRKAGARMPDLHVVLGGPGWDSVLDDLRKSGISASATGYIRRSELPHLYSSLHAYLMTSRVEGGPCTVFEAMACETPVVATRVGAVPQLISDGVSGYSTEVDDADALSRAILSLEQSDDRGRQIGRNGGAVVRTMSWDTALSPLGQVYASVTQNSRRRILDTEPGWMSDPLEVMRTSSAADTLGVVIAKVRSGSIDLRQGLHLFFEMLDSRSPIDILKGLALLRGMTYKCQLPNVSSMPDSGA